MKAHAEFCNDAGADVLCFTNDVATDADGWAMIAPYGDFPGMASIPKADGSVQRLRAVQRLDRKAADTMVSNFKSLWGRVRRYITGAPIFLGHPDGLGIGHRYADKTPKGMFSDLEARDTGLFGKPVFSNEGIALLEKFPAFSGRWTATLVGEETINGQRVQVFRPDVFKSAGLTDRPNLPVELLNELTSESGSQGASKTNTMKLTPEMIALFKKLGIELNNDSTAEQLTAVVDGVAAKITATTELANDKAALTAEIAVEKEAVKTKAAEITALTGQVTRLTTDFSNERAARRDALLDQALVEGRITPADKPDWKKKLDADFANESATLAKKEPVMKISTRTGALGQRTAEIANVQERQAKVAEMVNETMEKNSRLSYDDAFAKVRREHKALFDQMQAPEKK